MRIIVHPDTPEIRKLKHISEILADGGIIIYPTDTVYALGCDMYNKKSIEKLCQIKGIAPKKALFSVVTDSLGNLSLLSKGIDTPQYRLIKNNTPGPFTFILNASKEIPHFFNNNRKTIGIRIPENKICLEMLADFGKPLVSTTLPILPDVSEYTDPDYIYDHMSSRIDALVDGGFGGTEVSTIVDMTSSTPEIIRQGKGLIDEI